MPLQQIPFFGTPENPEKKALFLLLRHLTPEQQEQLLALGYFDMRAGNGLDVRIHNVGHGFVEVVNAGYWCVFTPDPSIPIADETLAKKLYWEAHESYERVGVWNIGVLTHGSPGTAYR
jgi:hypothetical protein